MKTNKYKNNEDEQFVLDVISDLKEYYDCKTTEDTKYREIVKSTIECLEFKRPSKHKKFNSLHDFWTCVTDMESLSDEDDFYFNIFTLLDCEKHALHILKTLHAKKNHIIGQMEGIKKEIRILEKMMS